MADVAWSDSDVEDVRSLLNDSDLEDEAVPELSVRDPALRARDETKRREAGEYLECHYPLERRELSIGQEPLVEESAPVLDAGPLYKPPPDYAAATANREEEERLRRAQLLQALGYRDEEDFAIRNRPDAFDSEHPLVRNGLLSERPHSTSRQETNGNPSDDDETRESSTDLYDQGRGEETSLISEKQTQRQDEDRIQGFRQALSRHRYAIILTIIIISVVLAIAPLARSSKHAKPVEPPFEPTPFQQTSSPRLPHPQIAGCSWAKYDFTSKTSPWIIKEGDLGLWNPFNFSVIEDFAALPHNIELSGRISIWQSDDDNFDIEGIHVDIATTEGLHLGPVNFRNTTPGELELLMPSYHLDRSAQGCIDVSMLIRFPKIINLDEFSVNTTNLDILFERTELFSANYDKWLDNWRHSATIGESVFHAARGNITVHGWESGHTQVSTNEGSINGVWPLLETLSLETRNGDISIGVAPQNRSRPDEDPFPWHRYHNYSAVFNATSQGGSIKAEIVSVEGQAKIPDRDFVTHLRTSSGDIRGDFLLGSNASFTTTTGEVNVQIVPVYSNQSHASFHADTGGPWSSIWFTSPYLFDPHSKKGDHIIGGGDKEWNAAMAKFMDAFHYVHSGQAGTISTILSGTWAGRAELRSETGQLWFEDSGYQLLENKTGLLVLTREGLGKSLVQLSSTSGDVYLQRYER